MIPANHIEVSRRDIRQAETVSADLPDIGDGEILLEIEKFALTTNNITYAAAGEQLGYWKFFPVSKDDAGIVPVWGFARVAKSACDGIAVGERIYGFLPMASHAVMRPGNIRPHGFTDAAPHRTELPAVYNDYQRLSGIPGHDPALEELQALLQPLFVTSWLLFDFLQDNHWFGAEQVIIGSASSKTGLGLAKYLAEARPAVPKIVGLTSPANREFVERLDSYDQVVAYSAIEDAVARIPSAFIDMAGNAEVRKTLHEHLADNMKHSAAVGTSHWDKFSPTGELPGAKPKFFFAPAQIKKRRKEWGAGAVQQRISDAWQRLARTSGDWLTVQRSAGLEGALAVYGDLSAGRQTPDVGHVVEI